MRLTVGRLDLRMKELELVLVREEDTFRPLVEGFVRKIYRKRYGADLKTFCRELLVLRSETHGVISCIGINTPESGSLFLEQYLDNPVEKKIARCISEPVERNMVVEVGTMGVSRDGICRLMMAGLAGLLMCRGKRFIVCTAVKSLRNTLSILNIPFYFIDRAVPEKLKGCETDWGDYYTALPEVIVIDMVRCWKEIDNVLSNMNNNHSLNMAAAMNRIFLKGMLLGNDEYMIREVSRCSYGGQ